VPAISSEISHVAGFRLATLASTQPHAVVNTNLQNKVYTTQFYMPLFLQVVRTAISSLLGISMAIAKSILQTFR